MALDWLPIYPTPARRLGVQESGRLYVNLDVPGIIFIGLINPPPPTELTWYPHYPDRTYRAPRVVWNAFSFQWPMIPVADLRWLPHYPDRLTRPTVPPARMQFTAINLGAQQVIAQQMFWQARYPNQIPRFRQPIRSQMVYPIQPGTLIAAAACVEWDEVSLLRSQMTVEDATRPSMTCDRHELGYLLTEDGGFLLLEDGGRILLEDQTTCPDEVLTRSRLDEETLC